MTKRPDDDIAALLRQYTPEFVEILFSFLRDPQVPDDVRRDAELALIAHGLIKLPEGPMRPCRVH